MLSTVETSEIRFRQLVEREIRDYVSRYPVLRFAGAFEGDGVLRFADSARSARAVQLIAPQTRALLAALITAKCGASSSR